MHAQPTPGTFEILDVATRPAPVSEGQAFELVLSRFNLDAVDGLAAGTYLLDIVIDSGCWGPDSFTGIVNVFPNDQEARRSANRMKR